MSNQHQIVLFYDGELFSPYYFYSKFLSEVASYYRNVNANETVAFQFTDGKNIVMGNYRVDPIALPLLLSLSQQLRLNQAEPIRLELSNVPSTNALIEFLFRSDFFYLSGNNTNSSFPQGKNIFSFDEKQIGDFHHRDIRPEHKIRCYSLLEAGDLVNIAHIIPQTSYIRHQKGRIPFGESGLFCASLRKDSRKDIEKNIIFAKRKKRKK